MNLWHTNSGWDFSQTNLTQEHTSDNRVNMQVAGSKAMSSQFKGTKRPEPVTTAKRSGIWKPTVRSFLKTLRNIFASVRRKLRKLTRRDAPDVDGGDNNPTCGEDVPSDGSVLVVSMPDEETAEDIARMEQHMNNHPPVVLIVDSGADYHVVGNRDLLIDIVGSNKKLRTAKGEDLGVVGVGTLVMSLGYYYDVTGTRQIMDLQIPNVFYAPECCFNLLSLSQLNEDNIHLNTEVRSVIIPGPPDMKVPTEEEEKEWCQHKYTNWRMLQRTDAKKNPALWAEYSVDNKPTLRGWVSNSGEVWVHKTGMIAAVEAANYEAGP